MNILTINSGSSSLRLAKFSFIEGVWTVLAREKVGNCNGAQERILQEFVGDCEDSDIGAVIHRFVHGGNVFSTPCVLSRKDRMELEKLSPLAPLHNPAALLWLDAAANLFPDTTKQIAVFDTMLYSKLSDVVITYGLPYELCLNHGLRRFGFHGLAHSSMKRSLFEMSPNSNYKKIITIQLGSGCSMTAFNKGDAVDTSMGFSPLEGLLMATRPGDLDSGILMYLLREVGLSFPELNQMLNEKSGLKGISGKSSDIRELIGSMESRSKLAVEVYCYRIRKYLGAFLSVLEGADSIVFGGGVGENNPLIREKVLSCFHWLGLEIDSIKNEAAVGKDLCISAEQSNIDVWVLQVDEAREMILQTENLIK